MLTFIVTLSVVNLYFAAVERKQRAEEERASLVPPEALVFSVESGQMTVQRRFAARLQPWREAMVAAEVEGRILETSAETGDRVEGDHVLFRIDATLAELNLRAAEAALAATRARLEELARKWREAERLAATGAMSSSARDAARSAVEVEEAEIARLETEVERFRELLARHEVRAPFTGSVRERMVDVGERVAPGEKLASVVVLDPLRVVFFVSDREFQHFRPGSIIEVEIPLRPGERHRAAVAHVAPAAPTAGGGFRIEARLDNANTQWPGGIAGTVLADLETYRDIPFIPASAVRFEGARAYVEITTDGATGEMGEVVLGPEIEGMYPVHKGLEPGQRILIR